MTSAMSPHELSGLSILNRTASIDAGQMSVFPARKKGKVEEDEHTFP